MRGSLPFPGRQSPSTPRPSLPGQRNLMSVHPSAGARLLAIDHLVDQIILISDYTSFPRTRYGTFSQAEDMAFSSGALGRVLGSVRRQLGGEDASWPHAGIFPLPRELGALACANRFWRDTIWERQWDRVVVNDVGFMTLDRLGPRRLGLIRYVSHPIITPCRGKVSALHRLMAYQHFRAPTSLTAARSTMNNVPICRTFRNYGLMLHCALSRSLRASVSCACRPTSRI